MSERVFYRGRGSEVPVPPPRVSGFQVPGSDGGAPNNSFEFGFQVPGSGLAVRPGPRFRGSEVPGSTLGRRFQVPGKRGWGDAEHGACHALRRARNRTTLAHFCFEKTFLCDNLWGCELESGQSVRVGARRDSGRPNREVRT